MTTVSQIRQIIGRIALILLAPLLFLALIEGAFRIFSYGIDPHFVVRDTIDGRPVLRDNPDIGKLWFEPGLARSPVPFVVGVKSNQVRIVLIGESAAMGDPAPAFGIAPALASILKHRYSNQTFEVINAAMTAIDSSILVQIARDLAPLKPDLVIVYMGNNEIVGPFGPAPHKPTHDLFADWYVRGTLWVRSLRCGQWFRDFWYARKPSAEQTWRGLGQFVDRELAPGSSIIPRMHDRFGRNVDAIIDAVQSYGADPVLCTMATRLNWPPFITDTHSDVAVAEALEKKGEWRSAYYLYRLMLEDKPESAEWRYRVGRALMAMGDPDGGIQAYKQSRDLDRLRFRADSKMNRMIRERADRVALMVDLEGMFDSLWVEQSRFFWDHVHLTPDGNFVAAAKIVRDLEPWFEARDIKADAAIPGADPTLKDMLYTELDRLNLYTVMHARMLQPPLSLVSHHHELVGSLSEQIRALRKRINRPFVEQVRVTLAEAAAQRPDDHALRHRLARVHEELEEYESAGAIHRELIRRWPHVRAYYKGVGRQLIREGRIDEGLAVFEQAEIPGSSRAMAVSRIEASTVLAEWGHPDQALQLLDELLQREPRHAKAWYNRAIILNRIGNQEEAFRDFQTALRYQPDMAEAFNNLGVIALKQEKPEHAEQFFRQALSLDPLLISAMRNLAMVTMLKGDWELSLQYSKKLQYLDPEIGEVSTMQRIPSP